MPVTAVQNLGPQVIEIKNRGLFTAPNQLSLPDGALVEADNCVIDEEDLLESRRGLDRLAQFSDPSYRASRYYAYQGVLLAAYGPTSAQWGGNLAYYNSGWQPYSGTFNHPDPLMARLRFLEAESNLYLTTSAGIYKLDAYNGTPTLAGMYGALDLTASTTGSSGFFTNNPVVTLTANTQSSSMTLTALSTISGIAIGQYVSGTGITAGTTVSGITQQELVLQTIGSTTAGSNVISNLGDTAGLAVGQVCIGNNIPAGTTVTAKSGPTTVLSTTCTLTAGSATMTTLASTVGLAVGQLITAIGVPAGTYVQSINGTTVTMANINGTAVVATVSGTGVSVTFGLGPTATLSNSATSTVAGGAYQFLSPATVTLSQNATATNSGVSLTFSLGSQVAYRVTWGIEDANQNQIVGSPSNRAVVVNALGTACNVNLSITIPSGITTANYFQLWRTAMSPSASIDPGDEPQLVYEGNPTSAQISAGSISLTDLTPDSLRGASLYTNASQQGISQANARPPLAHDMALFRNFTFYANTVSKQILSLTIIGVGSPNGIQSGDTLTIAGTTYTADTTETPSTGHFQVYTSGTPSQNIANSALSLVRVINQYASNTSVYASYVSGVNDLPGMLSIQERGIGGSTFYATASAHGSAYNPALPTSGTSVASTNNKNLNGLMYSKAGQSEAVPLDNIYYVGSASNRILRILPLRDALFILKEREGIYILTGYDPSNFLITLFDSSARLLAPDSAVVLNNQIWALTDQGVTVISSTGSAVQSRPIEDQILASLGASLSGVQQLTTGVGYETDRKYILSTITGSADTTPTQCFVFNTFTQAFTRWPVSKTCGYVNPVDNKLYLGDGLSDWTNVERKSYALTDFADEAVTYTISSVSGQKIFLTTTNGIAVGDRIYQSASVNSLITDVEPSYVTVADNLSGWTPGSCTVYTGIDCVVEYAPVTAGNAGLMKQMPEISMLFKQNQFNSATVSFASDVSPYFEPVPISGNNSGLWALFPWANVPWGSASQPEPTRLTIPLEKQWSSQLRVRFEHRNAWGIFKLQGFSIPVTGYGSWTTGK